MITLESPIRSLMTESYKRNLDYLMIVVMLAAYFRFFNYFLVIENISKMILVMYSLFIGTWNFIFLYSCYLVMIGSVFTTLYQDINPAKFGGLTLSCRTLFNAAMGAYDYGGMGSKEDIFSVLQILHVYLANIILLNLLIAILTEIMEIVGEKSTFKYLVNLYIYCERYMIAFDNESFGEIVIHPPPINFLSALLVPMVLLKKEYTAKICKAFSYSIYWIENFIFILVFFGISLLMIPFAYAKVFTRLYNNTP